MLIVSALLALIPLLFIAYTFAQGVELTVDNLFFSLIMLTISSIFGLNVLLELRSRRKSGAQGPQFVAAANGVRRERGLVESVQFFESPVGFADKSLVTFRPKGSPAPRLIAFDGDLRSLLPAGKNVELTYEGEGGSHRVLSLNYK